MSNQDPLFVPPKEGFFKERIWIHMTSMILGAFTTSTVAGVLMIATPFGNWINAMVQVPSEIKMLHQQIEELSTRIDVVSGERRVIRQVPNMSYVVEPVYQHESVTMVISYERTEFGEECVLEDWTPIFIDVFNIPTPGESLTPTTDAQLDGSTVVRRVLMAPPENLHAGRVIVYLAMLYRCNGMLVPETSDTVVYMLQEGTRPPSSLPPPR